VLDATQYTVATDDGKILSARIAVPTITPMHALGSFLEFPTTYRKLPEKRKAGLIEHGKTIRPHPRMTNTRLEVEAEDGAEDKGAAANHLRTSAPKVNGEVITTATTRSSSPKESAQGGQMIGRKRSESHETHIDITEAAPHLGNTGHARESVEADVHRRPTQGEQRIPESHPKDLQKRPGEKIRNCNRWPNRRPRLPF
jgi:hypothetical protein